MKIIDLLDSDFTDACEILQRMVTNTYEPDLIIGIATGGAVVVRNMPFNLDKKIIIIKKQRPFTQKKRLMRLDKWLPYLPRFISNLLRVVELRFNEFLFHIGVGKNVENTPVEILDGDVDDISLSKRILIVDDSVDSGLTLKECLGFVKKYAESDAQIKTASINVTFSNPIVIPTYSLYFRTIVRYPWASDVRENNEKNSV